MFWLLQRKHNTEKKKAVESSPQKYVAELK